MLKEIILLYYCIYTHMVHKFGNHLPVPLPYLVSWVVNPNKFFLRIFFYYTGKTAIKIYGSNQCWGSVSSGSVCFWASRIPIRTR
jgi:hypothetical protein